MRARAASGPDINRDFSDDRAPPGNGMSHDSGTRWRLAEGNCRRRRSSPTDGRRRVNATSPATLPCVDGDSAPVELRPYDVADRTALAALVRTVLAEHGLTVDPVLEADLDEPDTVYDAIWVAVAGGTVVGPVAARILEDGMTAELKRMYLLPRYRGRGLGRALLSRAVTGLESAGARQSSLTPRPR